MSSVANMGQTGSRDNAMLLKKSQSQGQIPGLVTNSILFCWLFTIKDRCKKVRFQQTHNEVCPCFSVVPETTHEASRAPLKDAMSAQKVIQESETETRELLGGREKKGFPRQGANQWFFTKRKQEKIELGARPVRYLQLLASTRKGTPLVAVVTSSLRSAAPWRQSRNRGHDQTLGSISSYRSQPQGDLHFSLI